MGSLCMSVKTAKMPRILDKILLNTVYNVLKPFIPAKSSPKNRFVAWQLRPKHLYNTDYTNNHHYLLIIKQL